MAIRREELLRDLDSLPDPDWLNTGKVRYDINVGWFIELESEHYQKKHEILRFVSISIIC